MRRIRICDPKPAFDAIPWDVYEQLAREAIDKLCAGDRWECVALREYFGTAIWNNTDVYEDRYEVTFDPHPDARKLPFDGILGDILAYAPGDTVLALTGDLFLWDGGFATLEVFAYADEFPTDLSAFRWEYARLTPLANHQVFRARNGPLRDPESFWRLDHRKGVDGISHLPRAAGW